MHRCCGSNTGAFKKKLETSQIPYINKSEDFAQQYIKVVSLLRFYFKVNSEELKELTSEELIDLYMQLSYALEFDAIRSSGDEKRPLKMPL